MTVLDSREQVGFGLGELTALAARLFLVGRLGGRRRMVSTIRVGVCLFILGSGTCVGAGCFDAGGRVDGDAGVDAEAACEAGEPCGVGEEGAGATCREKPSDGDVECRETECCKCRDDDGDSIADYGVEAGMQTGVVEEECRGENCMGMPLKKYCSCTFKPSDGAGPDDPSGVCTSQPPLPEQQGGGCKEPDAFEPDEGTLDDGRDNDCDGTTDEGSLGAPCAGSEGSCEAGSCLGEPGKCVHEIFVTSKTYKANFGNLEKADKKCVNSGGEGNWKAVLSTRGIEETDTKEVTAKGRLSVEAEVRRPDGELVANEIDGLWNNSLINSVTVDQNRDSVRPKQPVWTGTLFQGSSSDFTCLDWKSPNSGESGRTGEVGAGDGNWVDSGGESCDKTARLYCINGQKSDEGK